MACLTSSGKLSFMQLAKSLAPGTVVIGVWNWTASGHASLLYVGVTCADTVALSLPLV
jgi:hypothetical protein